MSDKFKPLLKEYALAALAALAAAMLLFAPAWFGLKLIYAADYTGSDLLDLNLPLRYLAAQNVLKGSLPVWTSQIGCGFPLLGEGQGAILYPMTLPLFMLFSVPLASNLTLVMSLALAAWGAYLWARICGLSRGASIIAALTAGFSPILIFRIKHLNMLQVLSWLPLSMAAAALICQSAHRMYCLSVSSKNTRAAENSSSRKSGKKSRTDKNTQAENDKTEDPAKTEADIECAGFNESPELLKTKIGAGSLLLALCWAMQILAGHPHMTYICGLSCLIYAFLLSVRLFTDNKPAPKARPAGQRRWLQTAVLAIAAAAVLAVMLGSVQLLPTFELTGQSSRGAAKSLKSIERFPFTFRHLVLLANPYVYENPAQNTNPKRPIPDIRDHGVFWESMPCVGFVSLFLILAAIYFPEGYKRWEIHAAALIFIILAMGPQGYLYIIPWKICPGFNLFRFPARFLTAFGAVAAIWAGMGADILMKAIEDDFGRRKASLALAAAAVLIFANFFWITQRYVSYLPASMFNEPESVRITAGSSRIAVPNMHTDWMRAVRSDGWQSREDRVIDLFHCLNSDSLVFWGRSVNISRPIWEGGISLEKYYDMQNFCRDLLTAPPNKRADKKKFYKFTELMKCVYSLQNISHLASFETWGKADSTELPLAGRIYFASMNKHLNIYKTGEPSPRICLSKGFIEAPVFSSFKEFCSNCLDVVSEEGMCVLHSADSSEESSLKILKAAEFKEDEYCRITIDKPDFVQAEINTDSERAVVLGENYYNSWRAELDGREIPVNYANYCFMGCKVPAGRHTLTFKFVPVSLYEGLAAAAAGLCLVLMAAVKIWHGFRQSCTEPLQEKPAAK